MQSDLGWTRGSWPSKCCVILFSSFISHLSLLQPSQRLSPYARSAATYTSTAGEWRWSSGVDADNLPLPDTFILPLQMHLREMILTVMTASLVLRSILPPLLLSGARHVASLPLQDLHTWRMEIWGCREPVFSASTKTWLRIIALSDALRLSALLCTTTLIRLLPWLMATSPPLEEKVSIW